MDKIASIYHFNTERDDQPLDFGASIGTPRINDMEATLLSRAFFCPALSLAYAEPGKPTGETRDFITLYMG